MSRGNLIVFEGIDRSGKTTQSLKLVENFNLVGIDTVHMCFPNRETKIGGLINEYLNHDNNLNDQVIHLLFSANRWEQSEKITSYLDRGINVVLDRYSYSGAVYTASKGYDLEWCKASDIGLPKPDIIFFMDLPVEEAMERENLGEERYESKDFQNQVSKNFRKLIQDDWIMVDARLPVEILSESIFRKVKTVLLSL